MAGEEKSTAVQVRHRWLTLAVLCVTLLLVSLDNLILNVALPVIVRTMHASSTELQWIVDAYVIVFAGLLLVLGSLGDRIGRKWVFVVGLAVFAAGSAASAFSGSPHRLIIARACMGIGGAAIMPSSLSILTNVFREPTERARAIGIWSGTTGLGVALGPLAGGWLLARFWWGSVFLINVPIALLGLLAALFLVPNSSNPASKRPDPGGAVLSMAGMGLFLWGVIEAPNHGWTSPLIIGSLAGGLAVLGAFLVLERRSAHPMLQLEFFGNRHFSAAIGAMAMVIFALFGALFLLTQYLQFSLGYSAYEAGLRVAPVAAVLLVVAPLSSVIVRFIGTKPVVFCGLALIATGLVMLSGVSVHDTYGGILPALFLLGSGAGLSFAPCTESVMGSLPPDLAGIGSATDSTAIQIGGALGVAVLGSLLNTRFQGDVLPLVAHRGIPASVITLITGSLGGSLAVAHQVGGHLGAALANAARAAFVSGMDLALKVGAGAVSAAALVTLAALPNRGAGPEGAQRDRPPVSERAS